MARKKMSKRVSSIKIPTNVIRGQLKSGDLKRVDLKLPRNVIAGQIKNPYTRGALSGKGAKIMRKSKR
jgi:hypothetical protein